MKIAERTGTRLIEWGTVMALALCATTLSAASNHEGYAKVRYVWGEAVVTKAGGVATKLERYMVLHPGDTIKTSAKSHVDLMLGYNNGSFQVLPSSELTLDKLTYEITALETVHDTQLNLKSGTITGVVRKMAPGSKYEVKTPRGVASIRGTRYRISATGDFGAASGGGHMALVMPDGTIKTFTINAGQMLNAGGPDIRALTPAEQDEINRVVIDALSHGGFTGNFDQESRRFFFESQQEPYLPPIPYEQFEARWIDFEQQVSPTFPVK
jgi:hypothetical protein